MMFVKKRDAVCLAGALLFCLMASIVSAGDATVEVREYDDKAHWQGYNYRVTATSDNFCVSSISPDNSVVTPGFGADFKIEYKSGAFSYCGWRHSHQYFTVERIGDPNITAEFQWYKGAGKDPVIHIKTDDHGILHHTGSEQITIGFKK